MRVSVVWLVLPQNRARKLLQYYGLNLPFPGLLAHGHEAKEGRRDAVKEVARKKSREKQRK